MPDLRFSIKAKDTQSLASFLKAVVGMPSHTVITGTYSDIYCQNIQSIPTESQIAFYKQAASLNGIESLQIKLVDTGTNELLYDSNA